MTKAPSYALLTCESCEACLTGLTGWRRRYAARHEEAIKEACRGTSKLCADYPKSENLQQRAKEKFKAAIPPFVWWLIGQALWKLFWAWWERRKQVTGMGS